MSQLVNHFVLAGWEASTPSPSPSPPPPPPPGDLPATNKIRTVLARHVAYHPEDLFDEVANPHFNPCLPGGTGTGTVPYPPPPDGTPVVVTLPAVFCADAVPEVLGGHHRLAYQPGDDPLLAYSFTCCDATDDNRRVEPTCAGGAGLNRTLYAYLTDVSDCVSAIGKRARLAYSDDDHAWYGSAALRGGTLYLKFTCSAPTGYTLQYWGCEPGCDDPTRTGTGSPGCFGSTDVQCDDPLVVLFPQLPLGQCCDCPNVYTDTPAEVNVLVVGNCRHVVAARHVGYAGGGAGGGAVPVVASARSCIFDTPPGLPGCSDVLCGLYFTVTGSGDCACLSGSFVGQYVGGSWVGSAGACGASHTTQAGYSMSCRNNCDGTTTYSLNVLCGATNTGSATATIPSVEVEDLDVSFNVALTDPSASSCTGTCTSTYNMGSWTNSSSTCSPACDACPETPPAPYLPASPSEGQQVTFPCSGADIPPACCNGSIQVRVMRL